MFFFPQTAPGQGAEGKGSLFQRTGSDVTQHPPAPPPVPPKRGQSSRRSKRLCSHAGSSALQVKRFCVFSLSGETYNETVAEWWLFALKQKLQIPTTKQNPVRAWSVSPPSRRAGVVPTAGTSWWTTPTGRINGREDRWLDCVSVTLVSLEELWLQMFLDPAFPFSSPRILLW